MKNVPTLIPVLLLSAFLLPSACAQTTSTATPGGAAHQAFVQIYAQRDAAFSRKDVTTATLSFAPNFVFITQKGEHLDAAHYRKVLGDEMRSAQSLQSKTTLQTVTLAPDGKTATTMIAQHTDGHAPYRLLFVRKLAHFTLDAVKRELWVSTKNGWFLSQVQVVSQHQDIQT